jgi:hypothetical protein
MIDRSSREWIAYAAAALNGLSNRIIGPPTQADYATVATHAANLADALWQAAWDRDMADEKSR